jgi:hypothetical protein
MPIALLALFGLVAYAMSSSSKASEGPIGMPAPAWTVEHSRLETQNPPLFAKYMEARQSMDSALLKQVSQAVRPEYPALADVLLYWDQHRARP